ncbi:hypothetical protein HerbRD11066_26610 [Herbidospora sp. RD11066]
MLVPVWLVVTAAWATPGDSATMATTVAQTTNRLFMDVLPPELRWDRWERIGFPGSMGVHADTVNNFRKPTVNIPDG